MSIADTYKETTSSIYQKMFSPVWGGCRDCKYIDQCFKYYLLNVFHLHHLLHLPSSFVQIFHSEKWSFSEITMPAQYDIDRCFKY